MSFWQAGNKIPIKQTSRAVSSQNGLAYSGGQLIDINLPSNTIKFINPKETYLKFDLGIELPAGKSPTRLQLDGTLGGQSLIKDIRIYSGNETGNVLLEEIQNYNVMCSVLYDYDADDSIRNKRCVSGIGSTVHKPETRGTSGSIKTNMNDIYTNPYFEKPAAGNQTNAFTDDNFANVRITMPLHTGLFSSDKVYPNILMGCRIEILLEDSVKVIKQLDTALHYNNLSINPVFDSANGSNTAGKTDIANGDTIGKFYIKRDNSQYIPENCPFVVGEEISFANSSDTAATFDNASGNPANPVITAINASANASGGEGLVEIVLDGDYDLTSASTINQNYYVVSMSVQGQTTYDAKYSISDVELVVGLLDMGSNYEASMMKRMKEGGGEMNLDILTPTNYKYSQLASDVVANIRLPLEESRARSIISIPTDATVYNSANLISGNGTYDVEGTANKQITSFSTRSGLVGISDYLTSYQWFYDGKLNPSKAISTKKISDKNSIDAQVLIENEKALVQAGIPARSFSQFNRNFFISRALGLNQQVYDTRNKDFNLQVQYSGNAPTKNKLWNNFCFGLRRINIKGDNISVFK
jgi:hypothetical protein